MRLGILRLQEQSVFLKTACSSTNTEMKATLTFSSNKDYAPFVRDGERVELIRDELQEIFNREIRRDIMYSDPRLENVLCEVIDSLSNYIDYVPSDDEMGNSSEPPITAAEMHSAAWAQKQELRR